MFKRIAKALIRLRVCAGWSESFAGRTYYSFLFIYTIFKEVYIVINPMSRLKLIIGRRTTLARFVSIVTMQKFNKFQDRQLFQLSLYILYMLFEELGGSVRLY